MFRFAKNNPSAFYVSNIYVFLIIMMKIFGGLQTEISNIVLMIQTETIEDIVKDFIALGIISEIDNVMMATVGAVDAGNEIDNTNIKYPKMQYLK